MFSSDILRQEADHSKRSRDTANKVRTEKLLEFMKQKEYFHGTSTELANQFNTYANPNCGYRL